MEATHSPCRQRPKQEPPPVFASLPECYEASRGAAKPFDDAGEATFIDQRGGICRIEPLRVALQFLRSVLSLRSNLE